MNLPTFIVAGIIAIIFVAIIYKAIKDKKDGKSSCACSSSCNGCGMKGNCKSSE